MAFFRAIANLDKHLDKRPQKEMIRNLALALLL